MDRVGIESYIPYNFFLPFVFLGRYFEWGISNRVDDDILVTIAILSYSTSNNQIGKQDDWNTCPEVPQCWSILSAWWIFSSCFRHRVGALPKRCYRSTTHFNLPGYSLLLCVGKCELIWFYKKENIFFLLTKKMTVEFTLCYIKEKT